MWGYALALWLVAVALVLLLNSRASRKSRAED